MSLTQHLLNFILYMKHVNVIMHDAFMWNWSKLAWCDVAIFITSCINEAFINEIWWPTSEERVALGLQLQKLLDVFWVHRCHNLSLGLVTKTRAKNAWAKNEARESHFMLPRGWEYGRMGELNLHIPKWTPTLRVGTPESSESDFRG